MTPRGGALAAEQTGGGLPELSRQVKQAGLMERRPGYYTATIAVNAVLLAAGWTAFVLVGDSWLQVFTAAYLAVVFTQVGFLGHDAGHRQVYRSRRASDVLGLLCGNLAVGLSYGWWVGKHNRHHAHTNEVGRDPDIGAGVIAWTADQSAVKRGLANAVARYQAYLFFPMLLFEGLHLHVASVQGLRQRTGSRKRLEVFLLAVHTAGYLGALLLVLSPLHALAFLAVQQALFGLYMGASFAPNHKGMPILAPDAKLDYLHRQVLTARNVRGGRVVDFVFGGLNYQIEHHLFPSMPRPNLRRAQPLVQAFCRRHGLPYTESTLLQSYAQALGHLHTVGAPLRSRPTTRLQRRRDSYTGSSDRRQLGVQRLPRR